MRGPSQTTMLKSYEKEISWKAGAYAIAVHLALLGGLLISFNWKAAHPMLNVAEVELWESIPNSAPPPPPVIEPKIEPAPVVKDVPEPKPEAKVEEPKVDIALEKKKELEQKKLEEKAAKQEAEKLKKERLAAIQADTLKDEKRDSEKQLNDKKAKDELKKLQQELSAEGDQQALAAKASGELSGSPKLTKTSGIEACDDAVERAIMASQPLPLPEDVALKSQFRNLNLTFTPNN